MDASGAALLGIVPLLQVGNMAESLDYYTAVLGFHLDEAWPQEGPPIWAQLSRSGVSLTLTKDLGTSDRAFIAEKGNGVVFYILCTEVATLYEELGARGALIVQELVTFGGRQQFTVADVNGYVLTFAAPVTPPKS
jgi:uncharacterized glyoxalase superfamily protein PhnB